MKRKFTAQFIKHILAATTVSATVTAGTAFAIYAYQSGVDFKPSGIGREMNNNQVLFDSNDMKNKSDNDNKKDDKDKSEMWEKDGESDEKDKPETDNKADYLFENEVVQKTTSVDLNNSNNNSEEQRLAHSEAATAVTDIPADSAYSFTTSKENADVILGVDGGGSMLIGTEGDGGGSMPSVDGDINGHNPSGTPLSPG